MSTLPSLTISVALGNEDGPLSLAFPQPISNRNLNIENAPSKSEFALIEKYTQPVVWSVISHWIRPGIAGVNTIQIRRHTLNIHRDNPAFDWPSILFGLQWAIQQAFPDQNLEWEERQQQTNQQISQLILDHREINRLLKRSNSNSSIQAIDLYTIQPSA